MLSRDPFGYSSTYHVPADGFVASDFDSIGTKLFHPPANVDNHILSESFALCSASGGDITTYTPLDAMVWGRQLRTLTIYCWTAVATFINDTNLLSDRPFIWVCSAPRVFKD